MLLPQIRQPFRMPAPVPAPYPYQVQATDWLASSQVAILALDMGLGKTRVSIEAADRIGARRILVIAPAVALTNWIREFHMWQAQPRTVGAVYQSKDRPGTDVVVVNYDKLSRNSVSHLAEQHWDLVICDEAHALKSNKSKRTSAVYGKLYGPVGDPRQGGIVSRAKRVWCLTATPIPNHLGEMWTHIRGLAPQLLPLGPTGRPLNYWQFVERYCDTKDTPFGVRILGNKREALPEVKAMLKRFVYRLRKVDVLPDLPPIRFVTTVIEPDEIDAELKRLEDHPEVEELVKTLEAADASRSLDDSQDYETRSGLLDTIANRPGHLATLRRMTSLLKVEPAIRLLVEELESGALNKVIVFAVHRETVDRLAEGLDKFGAVKLYGGTPAPARQNAIDTFQNDPASR